jgi:hypothetical protein
MVDINTISRAREMVALAEATFVRPRTWTRRARARTASRRVVMPCDARARQWDMVGALDRARARLTDRDVRFMYGVADDIMRDIPRVWYDAYDYALAVLAQGIPFPRAPYPVCAVTEYNDRARSKHAVRKLLRHAIAELDAQLAQAAS